jgi:hypothetical protein
MPLTSGFAAKYGGPAVHRPGRTTWFSRRKGSSSVVYEFRTYTAAPGKIGPLHDRFRNGTVDLFDKHDFKPVGFWQPTVGRLLDQMHYMLKWESTDQMQAAWGAFLADPEWVDLAVSSERDGPLMTRADNQVWAATDYSPAP